MNSQQNTENIESLLSAESTTIEFKELLNYSKSEKEKQWLKTISAFANTKGGKIVVGVTDDKKKVGVSDIKTLTSKVAESINARIDPVPPYELSTVREDNKDYLLIIVSAGSMTPYYYNANGTRTAYIRSGDESKEAPPHILNKLILQGMHTTYDALESPYQLSKVSFTYLSAEFQQKLHTLPLTNSDLISFGLLQENGYLTYGGVLLCDQYILRHSRIFCTYWKYLEKGHVGQDAIDDKEYEGNILQLLNNAEMFIVNNSKKEWGVYNMRTVKHDDYPKDAIHEALVNAIIHRDYFDIGSEIHVDMYPDRVEIISPGGMFDGSLIQEQNLLTVASKRRNLVISDVFGRLNLMDRRGSGFKRIMDSYADEKVKPTFYSDSLYFKVTLPNTSYSLKDKETVQDTAVSISVLNLPNLTGREMSVLNIIHEDNSVSLQELAELLKLTPYQIRYIIDSLREKGILKHQGSKKSGTWEIQLDSQK